MKNKKQQQNKTKKKEEEKEKEKEKKRNDCKNSNDIWPFLWCCGQCGVSSKAVPSV